MSETASVELTYEQWAQVSLALAKVEGDEDVADEAREMWGETLDELKEQVTITSMDLLGLQEKMRATR